MAMAKKAGEVMTMTRKTGVVMAMASSPIIGRYKTQSLNMIANVC
jgi:cell division protein FtsI/penicillin-binding protein 2